MQNRYGLVVQSVKSTKPENDDTGYSETEISLAHHSDLDSGRCLYELLPFGDDIAIEGQNYIESINHKVLKTLTYIGEQTTVLRMELTLTGNFARKDVLTKIATTTTTFLQGKKPNDSIDYLFFRIDGSRRNLNLEREDLLRVTGKMYGRVASDTSIVSFERVLVSIIDVHNHEYRRMVFGSAIEMTNNDVSITC